MKLEKREITLNEYDSLKDTFYMEKLLLSEYVNGVADARRKEVRGELTALMREISEDMCLLRDLLSLSGEDDDFSCEE